VSHPESITCLVVEDQDRLRAALVRSLQQGGYTCLEARSGREALAVLAAQTQRVHVLLSDIRMPEMDGLTLLGEVRERYPDLAAVMVTGVAEVETAVQCLQRGAYDYITKPFQLSEVHARIERAVERRRLLIENRQYQRHLADLVSQQAVRIEELYLEGIQTLVHALEAKDPYTKGHSARVASYARATAELMGLAEDQRDIIALGADLHDIGKIGVIEAVLNKVGGLSDEEYRYIMTHTLIGERILTPLLRTAPDALAIVRSHHERVDGTGLPDGLAGEAIPLAARIVAVADAFDAMTSSRPYRPAIPAEVAARELRIAQGHQFDPLVVDAFANAHYDLDALPIATPEVRRRRLPWQVTAAGIDVAGKRP
jgi:response regulator RpfG family c-di-GMP phosphodiesterase